MTKLKSALILIIASAGTMPLSAEAATCIVPNSIANGQIADATKVMGDFNAVASCAQQGVTITGTPLVGSIATMSGSNTIVTGNLSGDVTTSGSTATALSNTGVAPGTYANPYLTIDAKGRVTAASNGSGGGGGGAWIVAYSWTYSTDGSLPAQTVNLDVSAFNEIIILYDQVTKSATGPVTTVFSVDGGKTFDNGSNYHSSLYDSGGIGNYDNAIYQNGQDTGPNTFEWDVPGIRTTGPKPYFGNRAGMYVNYAPITNVGLVIQSTYSGGSIRVLAR